MDDRGSPPDASLQRLTLRDEAVAQRPQQQGPKAQPAESSQSEWELSGEDGEDGEGGDSGEEATPTAAAAPKTVSSKLANRTDASAEKSSIVFRTRVTLGAQPEVT